MKKFLACLCLVVSLFADEALDQARATAFPEPTYCHFCRQPIYLATIGIPQEWRQAAITTFQNEFATFNEFAKIDFSERYIEQALLNEAIIDHWDILHENREGVIFPTLKEEDYEIVLMIGPPTGDMSSYFKQADTIFLFWEGKLATMIKHGIMCVYDDQALTAYIDSYSGSWSDLLSLHK